MRKTGVSPGHGSNGVQVTHDRKTATANREKRQLKKRITKIATWNVRTLFQKGKLDNVLQEAERLNLSVLGISEMRWNNKGCINKNGWTVIYSENDKYSNGVGVFVNEKTSNNLIGHWGISDRVILVKIKEPKFCLSLIQVYAPTSDANDQDIEQFYDELNSAIKKCKGNEVKIVMGDFNAKVGNEADGKIVGKVGLGFRNGRGDILVEWCNEQGFCIVNTCFQQPKNKLWTWKSPDGVTKNQIDFILVPKRFRTSVINVKTYPGADCDSDHVPVVAKFRLKLKRISKPNRTPKLQLDKCKDPETRLLMKTKVTESMKSYYTVQNKNNTTPEEEFVQIKNAIMDTANEILPKCEGKPHKGWMNQGILDLMEERRKAKQDPRKYDILNKEVKKLCNAAYEKYLNEICQEVEKLYNISPREAHEHIKTITGKFKTRNKTGCLTDKNGDILMEEQDILKRWHDYIEELYEDPERPEKPFKFSEPMSGPGILKSEIEYAMKRMKINKAVGPDNIPVTGRSSPGLPTTTFQ